LAVGEFMAVKKAAVKKKAAKEVQGRAAGEDVKGSEFLEVITSPPLLWRHQ
jgi:hypothetical protein